VSLQQALVGSPHYGMAMPRLLSDAGIACRILTDGDVTAAGLKGLRCVVAASVPAVSDGQLEALRQFIKNGGKLVAIGDVGTMEENALPRQPESETGLHMDRRDIAGLPGYARTALPADAVEAIGRAVRGNLPADDLLLALSPKLPCEIRLYSVAPDRWRIYLVNYGVTKAGVVTDMQDVRFTLRLPEGRSIVSAIAHSNEPAEPQQVTVLQREGLTILAVPSLHIWSVLDVKLK
jgi:hypothetical protein